MKVYNTLSGQKEEFLPQGDEVKMYVCGVTPYDHCHFGHAMSYIAFDVIRRYLHFRGYKVKYVQNITDIDDKIIDRANKLGISPGELAEKYTNGYFEDMDALNIERADIYPRATEEIPKIIEVIQALVAKGYAYPAEGSVYFRVRNVADYGKLAHRSLESMMAGARIEAGEAKEHPMDFALWKASKPGEPWWESPWGRGRPGWHIECSAMSLRYLGDTLDIHGGGQDLIFPHHENEIAQSESFTGKKPFVKYWLHNGLVQLGKDKMSKSLGNLITIKQALEKYSPDAIRIFVLSSHYRSPLSYSEEALEAAERGTDRLRQAAQGEDEGDKPDRWESEEYYSQRFIEAMDDDFNTAQALATLFDLARDINRTSEEGYSVVPAQKVLLELANILGLTLKSPEKPSLDVELLNNLSEYIHNYIQDIPEALYDNFIKQMQDYVTRLYSNKEIYNSLTDYINNQYQDISKQWNVTLAKQMQDYLEQLYKNNTDYNNLTDYINNQYQDISKQWNVTLAKQMQDYLEQLYKNNTDYNNLLISIRERLREAKEWQLADEIRAKLDELGITLEDTPKGTVPKRKK